MIVEVTVVGFRTNFSNYMADSFGKAASLDGDISLETSSSLITTRFLRCIDTSFWDCSESQTSSCSDSTHCDAIWRELRIVRMIRVSFSRTLDPSSPSRRCHTPCVTQFDCETFVHNLSLHREHNVDEL